MHQCIQRSHDKTILQVIISAVCVVNDHHLRSRRPVVSKVSVVNVVSDETISGIQNQLN